MFDVSRLTETFVGAADQRRNTPPPDLIGLVKAAGLDPSILEGLSSADVSHLLTEFGIDASGIAKDTLTGSAQSGILTALEEAMGQRDL